ncbi:monofunctional biosynthetic peptidoglycan transglycosylase [Afifella sp. IM 167]|uniref:monofunctional biosynthetic peptidoglycan transglycosylase n=1 Tax=Afifella sp. IM 167 TaxID=2033586 RepID=UPI001CCA08A8|nr:monofunctional biosynthetic peptidoglycan transglycosylase [Afifella sp. IM 167]MBZ8132863.1 monofunctional biosynthetic peptidoglycan transglycosylase [Afifella sp. IM 167]
MNGEGGTTPQGPEGAERRQPSRRRGNWLKKLAFALLFLALMPLLLIPIYSAVNPPVSALMVVKRLGGAPIEKQWVPLEEISPHLVNAVLMAEDAKFCRHIGIDFGELRAAIEEARKGGELRGASTITMQLVKNLFLWPGRSYIRKALEFPLALYADAILSKRRILEIYLNVVEWDRGVYGAQAAARHYFGKPAAALSRAEGGRLAATLPAPDLRDAARPGPVTAGLARLFARRAAAAGPHVGCLKE